MKKELQYILFIFISLLFLISCDEDPCEGINCDKGVCDSVTGFCICSDGYQRDSSDICTIMWSTKFAGSYTVTDSCTGTNPGTTIYPVTITTSSPTTFDLSTIGSLGQSIKGTHTNSTSFEIDSIFAGGTILTGTGMLLDTTFVINYILNDTVSGNIDTCTASFSN